MVIQIIKRFHHIEKMSGNHSEEYLNEILEQTILEDLVNMVASWVRICEGDKYKAAMYVIDTLDREDD